MPPQSWWLGPWARHWAISWGIEGLEGSDLWDENHEVGLVDADAVLDTPLLVALTGGTKVALKEVAAAEDNEGLLFLPDVPGQDPLRSGFQVVICDAPGDSLNMMESPPISLEEGLLVCWAGNAMMKVRRE